MNINKHNQAFETLEKHLNRLKVSTGVNIIYNLYGIYTLIDSPIIFAYINMGSNSKRTIYVGGLAEEVDEKILNAAFIPFGDVVDIQIPLDYETEKHRGFAFIEFENAEDAAAAIDNMVYFFASKLYV